MPCAGSYTGALPALPIVAGPKSVEDGRSAYSRCMGKRFRNQPCVYCGAPGETADHVFARNFFPVEHRADLPQVSACAPCNRAKSQLEHYLLSVLPFGGNHPASSSMLARDVPRRLDKNRKLHLALTEGQRDVLIEQDGALRESLTIPFDAAKLERLFVFIAKGLAECNWRVRIPTDYFVGAGFLSSEGERLFEQLMLRPARAEARGNLGDGLILYQGVQAIDDPCLTLWRFQVYGGILFGGDPRAAGEVPSTIWASTSRVSVPGLGTPEAANG
jgi:hypothetical protein